MDRRGRRLPKDSVGTELPFWQEALFGIEVLLLHAAPVYYGIGVPRGDDSGVVIIPGFLGSDIYLVEMYAWLRRIGYRPYYSGHRAERRVSQPLDPQPLEPDDRTSSPRDGPQDPPARPQSRRPARPVGGRRRAVPGGLGDHARLALPRHRTSPQSETGGRIGPKADPADTGQLCPPDCYTAQCTCSFLSSLRRDFPESIAETAIYTRLDGFVDWRYCITGDPDKDFDVSGTHIGLAFNPVVYGIIADRLALPRQGR